MCLPLPLPPLGDGPQVHLLDRKGTSELIAVQEAQPSYQQVEVMLRARPTSKVNMCGDALQMMCVWGRRVSFPCWVNFTILRLRLMRAPLPPIQVNMGLFDRLREEYQWSQDSLKDGPPR